MRYTPVVPMLPVLSREQVRQFDATATAGGVPSLLLMENAGAGATETLVRELFAGDARGKLVVVLCGLGNNGGDGLVVARHLAVRGARAIVFLAGEEPVSQEARANLEAWQGVGGEVHRLRQDDGLQDVETALKGADAIVDALFGTGLDRPVRPWHASLIAMANRAPAPTVALDLPSGLDANTGEVLEPGAGTGGGAAIEARLTVTFARHKLGLLTPKGAALSGAVHVVPIGVPSSMGARIGSAAMLLESSDLASRVAKRSVSAHKNSAGHVLVVGGSPGRVGAPQLVAHGALRAGAGLATVLTRPESASAIESGALEVMTARLDWDDVPSSVDRALEGKDAVVVGPGLGTDDRARSVVEYLIGTWQGPVVIDADALSLFAGRPTTFMAARSAILTPHPGELGRLLGRTSAQVESDRFAAIREIVAASGAVVVLKGAHTLVAGPESSLMISPVAASVLATAGSGDTLGGIIAALACSVPALDAAWLGVLLHAFAGVSAGRSRGDVDRGVLASEIADELPRLLGELARG